MSASGEKGLQDYVRVPPIPSPNATPNDPTPEDPKPRRPKCGSKVIMSLKTGEDYATQTNPQGSKTEEIFERFVEDVFLPMKSEICEWREDTAKESTREIRLHLMPDLGEIKFEEMTPALLRGILKRKAEQGLGRQVLNHLRGYLTDICRSAVAEGYLANNVAEGLKAPVKLAKSSGPKLRVTLQQYAAAWDLLGERERLCF